MEERECSWGDPAFLAPIPVMRGLVSALCERRNAIDSEFHESCVSSGMQSVAEKQLTEMLLCSAAEEFPFREIKKEYVYDPLFGGRRILSFMHMFDNFLIRMLDGYGATYDVRRFTDSSGSIVYGSLPELAGALSETLIAPENIYASGSSAEKADIDLQVCLNDGWAAQRIEMLKLLRYVNVQNGGVIVRYAVPEEYGFGESPQSAYDAIQSWSFTDYVYSGEAFGLECRVEYYDTPWDDPGERWAVEPVEEAVAVMPDFHGCPAAEHGEIRFDAGDLRDGWNQDRCFPFDPLCTTVSSGANTLVLSGGRFASWGFGAASGLGGTDTPLGRYVRGWQAGNVRVIYDYESVFNFK